VGDRLYMFSSVSKEGVGDDYVTVLNKDSGRRLGAFKLSHPCSPSTEAVLKEGGALYLYCVWMDWEQAPMGGSILRQELVKGAKGTRTQAGAILGSGQSAPELSVTPGRVLLIAPTTTSGELVALDTIKRKELWRRKLPTSGVSEIAPVQAGDRVYTVSTQGVAVFDADTGKQLYRHSIPYLKDESGWEAGLDIEPLVAGGIVYAPSTKVGWMSLDTTEASE
jgi:outer membrane protein assembly factor BamB